MGRATGSARHLPEVLARIGGATADELPDHAGLRLRASGDGYGCRAPARERA